MRIIERLSFRVAQPAIVFEHHGPMRGEHQPEIQEARVRKPSSESPAIVGHTILSRMIGIRYLGVIMPSVVYAPMPPVLGPRSPSKTRLWSCVGAIGRNERPSVRTMKESSSPFSPCLEQHARAAVAELVLFHQPANEILGLLARLGYQDAFPGAQTVRFHDDRPVHGVERANGLGSGESNAP